MKKTIRIPVFWQFIVMYLAICAFVMISLTPILGKATDLSRHSYLSEAQHALDKSGELFQKSVEETLLLPQKMNDFSAYSSLKLFSGGKIPREYYANLYLCKKYMSNQSATLEYVDELFIYLPGSSVVLGKTRVFDDVYQYLDFDLIYQNYSPDQVLEVLSSVDSHGEIFPAVQARVNMASEQKYLTVVGQRDNDSSVAGALFAERDLLKLFNLLTLPDNSFLYITDAAGEPVYAYQYDQEELVQKQGTVQYQGESYSLLSTQVTMPACTVTMGIPNSYFEEMHRPLAQMIFRCIFAAIVIGVLCSALFAAVNYMPIRRLEQVSLRSAAPSTKPWLAREYHSIETSMALSLAEIGQLRENAADMRASLRANLFIRLLYGSPEYSDAPELLPQLYRDYRVALFQITSAKGSQEGQDYLFYTAIRWLFERMPVEWVYGQTDPSHAAVLTGVDPADTQRIQDLLSGLNAFLQSGQAKAAVGLSGRFSDKEDLHSAFYHAQFSLAHAEDSPEAFYQTSDIPDEGKKPVLSLKEAQRLYETLMACKTEEMGGIFTQIQEAVRSGDLSPGEESIQAFYLIRTVLNMVAADARLTLPGPLTPYDQSRSMRHLLDGLQDDALLLEDLLTQRQSSINTEARSQVMDYIQQNFQRPDIYAASIAEAFHLSRNGVYALVREQTGKSLNEYLEDLRINHAVDLLKTTNMTVAEISAACGYNSTNTFYKVFKKRLGIPPSNLRP